MCKNCFIALTKIEFERRKFQVKLEKHPQRNNKDESVDENNDNDDDSLELKVLLTVFIYV